MAVAYNIAQKIEVLLLLKHNYNVTNVVSYYCNLVTFQTIIPSYKLLVTKQVTSYITSYFKSNPLRNLVTKVTSYPKLWLQHYQIFNYKDSLLVMISFVV